jgi:chemotaxis signal transduction protein
MNLLIAQVDGQKVALPASDLRGVRAWDEAGPLPVLSWRGQILPVLPLGAHSTVAAMMVKEDRAVAVGLEKVFRMVSAEVQATKMEGTHHLSSGAFLWENQWIPVLETGRLLDRSCVRLEPSTGESSPPPPPRLFFEITGNTWSLPVEQVAEVCGDRPVTPLPGSGPATGLIQLRGRVFLLVEPGKLWGDSSGRFLVILRSGLALRVERLCGVRRQADAPVLDVEKLLERLS